MMFNSQSGIRDIASRGSKSVRSEDIVAVKVDGGYVMVVVTVDWFDIVWYYIITLTILLQEVNNEFKN